MKDYNVSHSVWYKFVNIWALKRNSQISSSISGKFLDRSVNIWVITANNLTNRQTKEVMRLLWFKLITVTVNVRIWGHMKNKQATALNLLSLERKTAYSGFLLVHAALKLLSPDCRCYQKMNTCWGEKQNTKTDACLWDQLIGCNHRCRSSGVQSQSQLWK